MQINARKLTVDFCPVKFCKDLVVVQYFLTQSTLLYMLLCQSIFPAPKLSVQISI